MRLNSITSFFSLIRAGLWEKEVQLSEINNSELPHIYQLAQEQCVVGLLAAGLEHLKDIRFPKSDTLSIVGDALQLEQRNLAMNHFIGVLVDKLRNAGIYPLLVKGQGVAQCYERPLWRSCGDVDFLLDTNNYNKAKEFFAELATSIEEEEYVSKHIGYTVDPWLVELHGHMYFGLSQRANKVVVDVERDVLQLSGIRVWENNGVDVYLPNPDNDIIIVFTHFLGHFCFGGVGLRQICDLCRLLWGYREQINARLLKSRLNKMRLMSEWMVFASVAVNWLGMPSEAMPFYCSDKQYQRRAKRAVKRILKSGNLGHNIDESYKACNNKLKSAIITFYHRFSEYISLVTVFPMDAHLFFFNYLFDKKRISKAKKENRS